jgi:hypothetical protein
LKQLRHGRAATSQVAPVVAPASTPAPFDARLIAEAGEDMLALATMDAEILEMVRRAEAMVPGFHSDPDPDPEPEPAPSSPSSAPDLLTDILLDPSPKAPAGGNRRARLAARSRQRARA